MVQAISLALMVEGVQRRGAAGVIWYPDPYTPSKGFFSFSDQPTMIPWLTIPTQAVDGKLPTFAFVLSLREGIALHNRIAACTRHCGHTQSFGRSSARVCIRSRGCRWCRR